MRREHLCVLPFTVVCRVAFFQLGHEMRPFVRQLTGRNSERHPLPNWSDFPLIKGVATQLRLLEYGV